MTLEASALALTVKRTPAPHFAELVHKSSGTVLEPDEVFFLGISPANR